MKTYQETLDYLFAQLPMYQRVGAVAMKKDLGNISKLCTALGNPQTAFQSIHIAGTNGKGSVSHILASILRQAGYKVACYTSPHYADFRERIKIISKENGVQFISEQKVIDFVAKNKAILEQIKPSFFEMTVAMAFQHFAKEKVDFTIVETGLGGRLDSTNIIKPLLSVITNISKDHTQFLGNTLPEIAFEKAGIIKNNTPVIIGKKQEETHLVFQQKAKECSSKMYYAKDIVSLKNFETQLGKKSSFELVYKSQLVLLKSDLCGNYQQENLNTAISALLYLKKKKKIKLKRKHIAKGIKKVQKHTYFIGRNMLLSKAPLCIADSAHNTDGISILLQNIAKVKYEKLHFIYGTVSDKDVDSILQLLPKTAQFYFCQPNIARAMAVENLCQKAEKHSIEYKAFDSVQKAFDTAKANANENDFVLVAGSIFVVAEVVS